MREIIYNLIAGVLNGIKDNNGKEVIRHVDLWNQQTAAPMEEQSFYLPAVFIEFGQVDYTTLTRGRQTAKVDVLLHIVTNSRTKRLAEAMWANEALCNLICERLSGNTEQICSGMMRTASTTDTASEEWIENVDTYHITAHDNTAEREWLSTVLDTVELTTGLAGEPQSAETHQIVLNN
ncbi:MAG: hypothetical protein MJZ66_02850 [Bacteroidales bacterium]|nr:hypothetical protein [Bacteroidales bacterium]